jgi:opacity protein-like surface antigen
MKEEQKMRCELIAILMFAVMPVAKAQTAGNAFVGYSFEDVSSSTAGIVNGNRIVLNGCGRQSFPGIFFTYDAHEHELLFGPRASVSFGRIRPFGEVLFGWDFTHLDGGGPCCLSNSSFAAAVGGGADYRVTKVFALRAEGDYIYTDLHSMGQNNLRLSTGMVARF